MHDTNSTELQASVITSLRFPLILFVVCVHCAVLDYLVNSGEGFFDLKGYPCYSVTSYAITQILCRIAVPAFFFISGYLFFLRPERFSLSVYLSKLKRRASTLLLPYVVWNLLYAALYLIAQTLMPSILSGREKAIIDYSFSDWLSVLWNIRSNGPMDPPLWFLRDLMVLTLFTPVIYGIVRILPSKIINVLLIATFSVLFSANIGVSLFESLSFDFLPLLSFFWGCYLGIKKINLVECFGKWRKTATIIYLIMAVAILLLKAQGWKQADTYAYYVSPIVGIIMIFGQAATYNDSALLRRFRQFAPATFFIFAYHSFLSQLLCKIITRSPLASSDTLSTIALVTMPLLTAAVGILLHKVLSAKLPRLVRLLDGGR